MIAVRRRKLGVSISDIFFAAQPETTEHPPAALALFVQAKEYYPGFRPFKTQLVDLTRAEGALYDSFSSSTRYKIQRAGREGLHAQVEIDPSGESIQEYITFYDRFAAHKSLPHCNSRKLRALDKAGGLALSCVRDASGSTLAAHAYICDTDTGRTRLLYSASHFRESQDSAERNLIGRANRLLHWQEMLQFKQLGFGTYDLGGLPLDDSDPAKNSIARFKLEFGGQQIIEYNGLIPRTVLAKAALTIQRVLT